MRTISNEHSIELAKQFGLLDVFEGRTDVLLSWIDAESDFNQFAVRVEPYRISVDTTENQPLKLWRCSSWGLFQIMGVNIDKVTQDCFWDIPISFLQDSSTQFDVADRFWKFCPKHSNLKNKLMWWNTGSVDSSLKGEKYCNKIFANSELFR